MQISHSTEALDKALTLIRSIRIALLTTVTADGHFHTRPLQTLEADPNGLLWFFTDWNSAKVSELQLDTRVCLGYADSRRRSYLAVSGTARVFRDTQRAEELWHTDQRAYYPCGPRDSRLAILRIKIEQAEYWLAPGLVSYLVAAARASLSGTPAGILGENVKI
jgi:general stress protein 26